MKCEDAAEFVSALCDGEVIPQEAAEHIGDCEVCQARLGAFSTIGVELRRVASLQAPGEMKAGSWEEKQRVRVNWWQKGSATMKIPRFAFASMLGIILLLSGGLVLVRARPATAGAVLLLTYKIPPQGRAVHCAVTTDANPKSNHCSYSTGGPSGTVFMNTRFVTKEGERTELAVRARYESQPRSFGGSEDDQILKDVPEERVRIEPGEKQEISVAGLGSIELTGEYLDHMPAYLFRPEETLDPERNEFRIVSPVLIRGKEVVFNMDGSSSIDSDDQSAALMIYFPGEGRFIISTVPFEGSVQGGVELGQIKFSLDGQDYLLLTAMPTTRSEHVWVVHEPHYKLSEHMPGASDNEAMFMIRRLSSLLEVQIRH
jgi:hypothetical protein